MANTQINPEELQKAVLKWTALGAAGFVGAVALYVFLGYMN